MKILITISFLLTLFLTSNGCATPYQETGSNLFVRGGYWETKEDENVYRVGFKGNENTSMERATAFALLRGAEITLERGYTYFSVEEQHSYTNRGIPMITIGPAYSYTPTSVPGHIITIRCFQTNPPDSGTTYNAALIKKALSKKYDLQLTPSKGTDIGE